MSELVGRMQQEGPPPSRATWASRPRGYRTVFNCNREAGQTVFHLTCTSSAGADALAAGTE